MDITYRETVDWGIIRRQWFAEQDEFEVEIEKHEEDRFTVKIQHKSRPLFYYSFLQKNGSLTFGSLEEALAFAEQQIINMSEEAG